MQEQAIQKCAEEKGFELVMYVEKVSSRKNDRIELANVIKAATKELYKLTEQLKEK